MEKEFLKYLGTLENMIPDESIWQEEKKSSRSIVQSQNLSLKIKNLENKKKLIRKQFINDFINIEEYREIIEEIEKQLEQQRKSMHKLERKIEEKNKLFSYEEIKDFVTNIRLNWEYLNNQEKQQFLERFVDSIMVVTDLNNIVIKSVQFRK